MFFLICRSWKERERGRGREEGLSEWRTVVTRRWVDEERLDLDLTGHIYACM